jgi:hypothetical protein
VLVSRSLPPAEAQQAPSATTDRQALADRDAHVVEQSGHSTAEQGSSSSSVDEVTTSLTLQQTRIKNSVWLPLSTAALLSSLLLCGLLLVPLGSVLSSGLNDALRQWRVGASSPVATATTHTPYAFHDTLRQGNVQGWPEGSSGDGTCFFAEDGYHVKNGIICGAPVLAMSDGKIDVTMRILAGANDYAALIWFRTQDPDNTYDVFFGQSGSWGMGKVVGGKTQTVIPLQRHEAIHPGLNAANTVEIVMRATHLTVSVNQIQVGDAEDATFSNGLMALVAIPGAEAVFSDLSVIADA